MIGRFVDHPELTASRPLPSPLDHVLAGRPPILRGLQG